MLHQRTFSLTPFKQTYLYVRHGAKETLSASDRARSFARQEQITDYALPTLVELVRYVRSDDVLRSAEEEQRLLMEELGYTRRGARIQAVLSQAQKLA
jgi:hypothetical protein